MGTKKGKQPYNSDDAEGMKNLVKRSRPSGPSKKGGAKGGARKDGAKGGARKGGSKKK